MRCGKLAMAALALAAFLAGQGARAAEPVLEKLVVLMRHGVRPQTNTKEFVPVIPAAFPDWGVGDGQLTAHGAQAVAALGAWERRHLAARGLLSAQGCPAPGEVFAWANSGYKRTLDTGDALLAAMYPGCGVQVGHLDGTEQDPLFTASETEVGKLDPAQARAAIMEKMGGSFDRPKQEAAPLLAELQSVLQCCAPPTCEAALKRPDCAFPDLPWWIETVAHGRSVDLRGPMGQGSSLVQILLMEYANGFPPEQIGWGRAPTAADVIRLSALRKLKYEYQERVPTIARRGASNIANQVLLALEHASQGGPPEAKLVLFVGSDTQIAELGALLDAHWHVRSYLDDETPPGGGLWFELLRDPQSGAHFVRTSFAAQTLDQIRNLTPLDEANPPSVSTVAIPGCPAAFDDACPADAFGKLLRARMDPSAVATPRYGHGG